ncbi:DNA polymerase III subunit delta' [Paenibacillus hunanensis]|uniref:DNA polymerase III subunit delta' n=1 Tax=Paenibacillus hunanensis TaxID=539262 RepID=A0ABU1J6R7_9BACL|nr:DNA polymerase III subunit delta' [Paenibacillus hunanensis]MDR6246252.1 DNA polymerase-3 subunit delta' [Paenibacillus hunanensis]GGJ30265.1 DNA polymerase III subunit delta' [Paenibacillus hunanensis]
MSFQEIIGQETAKKVLQNGLRQQKISHAYLFHGPAGSGQLKMAFSFAQALVCLEKGVDACGHCIECRKMEHGNHPDFLLVEPDGSSIKIDQIRELQRIFSYRSEAGNRKIYIIQDADKMTVQAANSLLKFLEEPPAPAVAMLLTDNVQSILPTIRSRTQPVLFTAVDPKQMIQLLADENYPLPLVRCAVHLVSDPEECRKLLAENWFAEIRNVVLQLGKESASRGSMSLITAQQKLFKGGLGDHVDQVFDLFHLWFKDLIHIQIGQNESIVFIDQLESLSKVAHTRSMQHWISCMALAAECKKMLRSNVNGQLCMEQFLIGVSG